LLHLVIHAGRMYRCHCSTSSFRECGHGIYFKTDYLV